MKWEYIREYCRFKVTKTKMFGNTEGYWALGTDETNDRLNDRLNFLGAQGWELVNCQQVYEHHGGESTYTTSLEFFYIFKRPTS